MKQLKTKITGSFVRGLILLAALSGCQKVDLDDIESDDPAPEEGTFTVKFNVGELTPTDFVVQGAKAPESKIATRSQPVSELCSRINLIVYQNGVKLKQVNSKSTDENFGHISISLYPGEYEYVILAHSCDGNVSATHINKITFPDNKVTDTFHKHGMLSVKSNTSKDITMDRVTAKVHFVIEDTIPANVDGIKFYYTGGSSTIDGATGYGCVNSKQTEVRPVVDEMRAGKSTFDIYTIPHDDDKKLKIVVTALYPDETTATTKEIENVPIKRNQITTATGKLFDDGNVYEGGGGDGEESGNTEQEFELVTNDEWSSGKMITF